MFYTGFVMVRGVTDERCRGVLRLSFQPKAACIEGRHRGGRPFCVQSFCENVFLTFGHGQPLLERSCKRSITQACVLGLC